MEIESLKRKIPDLGDINDPYSFVQLMRQNGLTATSADMVTAKGMAVEVKVPGKELSLIFVTSGLCQNFGAK
jgi:hypothetical protein